MKKKNTRDYGKKLPSVPRRNYAEGGPIYNSFGDVTVAHINRAGGLTEGEDPEVLRHPKPGRVSSISCWSEDSTFNMPTAGYVPGRLLSGGLAPKGGGGGGGGKQPKINIDTGGGGGGGGKRGSSRGQPISSGSPDTGSTEAPDPAVSTETIDLEPPPIREGSEDI